MDRKKTGFSLVELLVVIAIILTLVALLLPMTLRLEDSANLMIDVNNFHKIYEAMYAYAEDHKGHIPNWQATKELGYYACWGAWNYWQPKLGLSSGDRNKYVGCDGHSSAGYVAVLNAYKEYVPDGSLEVFKCRSPKKYTYQETNYVFRTTNSCGAHGTYHGPPGGWVIGVHNPKAHIITEGGTFQTTSWTEYGAHQVYTAGEQKRPGPFDLVYANGNHWVAWGHMANRYPLCRLNGSAEVITYRRNWGGSGTWFYGGWFPGNGGV